jgi:hypothetical protein
VGRVVRARPSLVSRRVVLHVVREAREVRSVEVLALVREHPPAVDLQNLVVMCQVLDQRREQVRPDHVLVVESVLEGRVAIQVREHYRLEIGHAVGQRVVGSWTCSCHAAVAVPTRLRHLRPMLRVKLRGFRR